MTAIEFFERVPLKRIKKNVLFLIAENKIPITNLPGGMGKSGAGMYPEKPPFFLTGLSGTSALYIFSDNRYDSTDYHE